MAANASRIRAGLRVLRRTFLGLNRPAEGRSGGRGVPDAFVVAFSGNETDPLAEAFAAGRSITRNFVSLRIRKDAMIRFQNEGELAFEELVDNKTEEVRVRDLVLYNDDVNTFDFVIQCLIEVYASMTLCKQAEQCTYIVHYNGNLYRQDRVLPATESPCVRLLPTVDFPP